MFRKFAIIMLLLLCFSLISGCNNKQATTPEPKKTVSQEPAGPGPSSTDPKATAEKVLGLIEAKDWSTLYDYIYIDIQKKISREEFIKYNSQSKISYKGFKVQEPKLLPEWADKIDGVSFKNVAEVPYSVDVVTPKGNINMQNKMYLTQTPEKNWRYIWIKK